MTSRTRIIASAAGLAAILATTSAATASAGPSAENASSAQAGPSSVTELCTKVRDPNVVVSCGIPYVTGGDQFQVLDFYRPRNATKPPVVLMIHGGGWKSGGKESVTTRAVYLAQNGLAAVTIDYQWSTEATPSWTDAFDDVEAAQAWVVAHASDPAYAVDAGHLGVYGVSAGGNLGGLLATNGTDRAHAIESTVTLSAPMDLNIAWDKGDTIRGEINQFLGCTDEDCDDDDALLAEASPTSYVDRNDGSMLLFHSQKEFVPVAVAKKMDRELTEKKVEHELEILPGSLHASLYECKTVTVDGHTEPVIDAAVRWLGSRLLGHAVTPSGTFCPPGSQLSRQTGGVQTAGISDREYCAHRNRLGARSITGAPFHNQRRERGPVRRVNADLDVQRRDLVLRWTVRAQRLDTGAFCVSEQTLQRSRIEEHRWSSADAKPLQRQVGGAHQLDVLDLRSTRGVEAERADADHPGPM